jgi:hypothetical protein
MGPVWPRQCSRIRCLARWTVWIPHRGLRGRAGRENSKKDQVTSPIEVFCALQAFMQQQHADQSGKSEIGRMPSHL